MMKLPLATLELSLQPWGRTGGSHLSAFAASAALVAALILVGRWLRRPEKDALSRTADRLLAIPRCLIFAAIALALLFQPQIRNVVQENVPAYILIALDTSGSMGFSDAQAPDRELLELAVAVGLQVDGAEPEQLRKWSKQLAGGSVPDDAAYRTALAGLRKIARAKIARTLLNDGPVRLVATLRQDHEIRSESFADAAGADLAGQVSAGETNFAVPLAEALRGAAPARERCVGLVIVTDGRQTHGDNPLTEAESLRKAGIPVFPVVVGSSREVPDLAILDARANPAVAFRKSLVRVQARIKVAQLPKGSIRLKLAGVFRDRPVSLEQTFPHDGATAAYDRQFEIPGDEAGAFAGELAVEWLGPEKEAVLTNNRAAIRFQVVEDKARVLIVDSEMRYETHYLQTALRRDDSIDLKTVILNPPRLDVLSEEGLRDQGYPESRMPADYAEMMGYDCIIVGDVDFAQLPDNQRGWLEKYVAERGGTIVFVAGKKFMPLGSRDSAGAIDPVLARLLPVAAPHAVNDDEGFSMQPTAEGGQQPYLQLAGDAIASAAIWERLPMSHWGIVGKCKTSAVALAFLMPRLDPRAAVPMPKPGELERDNAILARQNIGFGKTLFLGLDSTWRWRYRQGDALQFRFWGQLIRWAASDRPLSAGNEFLRFGAREPVFTADRTGEVVLRFTEKAARLGAIARVAMSLKPTATGEGPVIVPLKEQPNNPLEWRATLNDLKPGRYELEPLIPELRGQLRGADGQTLKTSFEVLAPISREDAELSADFPLMKELAERTGGKALWAKDAAELPALLKNRGATRESVQTWNLTDSWWLFGTILFLLTVEWSFRKWLGLA